MWKALTGLALVVLVVWQPSVATFGGAAVGTWAVLALLQLGLLLGAVLFGVRVPLLVIGVGGEVRTWTRPHLRVVWRTVPLLFAVGLTSIREPVRRRLWLTALTAAVLSAGVVALAWLGALAWSDDDRPFLRGFAVAGTAVLVNGLWPRRGAGVTSPGWFLFGLPRASGRTAAEFEATPLVNQVSDALQAGDLDRAEAVAEDLVSRHPTLLVAIGAHVAVLTLRTKYAEALHIVSRLVGRTDLDQRDMAFVLAQMAGSTANAVEGGQLPADVGLPAARRAVDGAMQFGYPRHRCVGTLAQLALLEDDHATAITLGTQAKHVSESGLDRADALATIARAQMAAGDNAAARETLAEAQELAGWMPRVAETSARLNIG
ncbi:tetratricopeptide repeat protein [Saccharothrix hoggarensis]|uniref:Tetratricopeptide repeat protein n=1 Tax=Saccharothrix hoggarensis TaxID=913853 RepID=A0ABW3QPN8_9PSEU